nr:hypothetical protein [uncultured Rhodoferax sp.]
MNYRLHLGACVITTVMAACAQEPPRLAPPVQTASVQRLIIRFTTVQAIWGEAELAQLRIALMTDIQPIAAVSDITWVYVVRAQPGQSTAALLQALRARPEVAHVEADLRVKNP